MVSYTHSYFTNGKPRELLPLNIAGLKALARKRIELREAGVDDSVGNIETFEVLAFHTLRRIRPETTLDEIADHIDHTQMAELSEAIAATNGFKKPSAKDAPADFPSASPSPA